MPGKEGGWGHAALQPSPPTPPGSLCEEPAAERGQTPGREGQGEHATHHCRDSSWAWLAWRPRRPLKRASQWDGKRLQ